MTNEPIKVLLVEDDEDDYLLTRDLLADITGTRFAMEWQPRFEDALDVIRQFRHDVYLIDYRLGDHNGLDLVRAAIALGCRAPLILLTGQGNPEIDIEAMRAGASDFLIKGQFEAPLLERSIRYSMQQSRTLEELRESKEFAERIINSNVDGIVAFDRDYRFTVWNPGMERLAGISKDEAIGRSAFEVLPFLREIGEDKLIQGALEGQSAVGHDRPYHIEATDKHGFFEGHYSPLRNESGEIIGGLGIIRDITESKRLGEQLQHSQKLEAVGRLAGGVAHDFNNLLTAITGYSEIAGARAGDDHELGEAIEEIRKAARRAAALTGQLLTLSRRHVVQPKVLDLNAVVADVEKMLGRIIGEDVDLLTIIEPNLGRIRADRGQLEQVIMNLAVNARDAMPKGGSLTIETANLCLSDCDQHVGEGTKAQRHEGTQERGNIHFVPSCLLPPCLPHAHVVPPGAYVVLSVRDIGVGMDAQTRSRIFEPFFTTKGPDKGTGLGLSTVYGIIRQSNGHIFVDSEVGKGTTFTIYLPKVEGAIAPLASPSPPTPGAGRGARGNSSETLLLVEDQDVVRRLICRILRQQGYSVLEASHGHEAIDLSSRHGGEIQLMITDVIMPEMSGGELARRLSPIRPGMKVLYVSGYADSQVLQQGVDDLENFLQKPFTMDDLTGKVREILDAQKPAKA
ncbi:MAG TPA: response regulator [Tepidisphaeraceae bacterium]|jgi:PAS domain S-box-containing protein